jgi:hypothetical protein
MNKQVSGPVIVVIVIVVVIILAFVGYKVMKPPSYQPSPRTQSAPNYGPQPGASTKAGGSSGQERQYTMPPKGAEPGAPPGYAQPSHSAK